MTAAELTADIQNCSNICVKENIQKLIEGASCVSWDESEPMAGFNMLALDPYCQGWLDIRIGTDIVWVNRDSEIVQIGFK